MPSLDPQLPPASAGSNRAGEVPSPWTDRTVTGLLNSITDAFYTLDATGRLTRYNNVAREIFSAVGVDAAALVGKRLIEDGFPDARGLPSTDAMYRALHDRVPAEAESFHPVWQRWFNVRHFPMPDGGIATFFQDTTERKRIEAVLGETERVAHEYRDRFDIVRDAAEVGFWFCDLPFDQLIWDNRVKEHFWIPPEDKVTIALFYERLHPEDRERARRAIEHSIASKTPYEIDYRTVSPATGRIKWVRAIGRTFYDAAGHPIRFDGVTLDITARRRAEDEVRDAKEKAEAANRAKDSFLAVLSHELRTPLTPVLMAAGALREDPRLPEDLRAQLTMIERNVALEARLIDDLLDLTAVAHGKLQIRREICDLHALIRLASDMVAPDAAAKLIRLQLDLGSAHSQVQADATRLQQVVWNLLRNAVKFTPAEGRVVVRTREDAAMLCLEVTDSGIGIAPENIARIFQPFDQGAVTGDHRYGGLGLGLAIARSVVLAHGGQLRAESGGPGQGARFTVTLPLMREPAANGPLRRPASNAVPDPVVRRHILLVEDHASTLETLSRLLQRDGHSLTTASSSAEARAAAARETFDLVISDLGLPDGDGVALMYHLHGTYGLQGIALSGYGMAEDVARTRQAGFVRHLVKPVIFADLRRAIGELAGAGAARD